jgi:hypothetical protein
VRVAGWVGLGWWALLLAGCRGAYSQPPTACDDYCQATQRASCSEDYPADCVRDCEERQVVAGCEPERRTLNDCYAAADVSSYTCVNDHSEPGHVCLAERRALSECLAPTSGPCFDQCVRQTDECGATLSDCEAGCHEPPAGCELASHDYNACLLRYPNECRPWLEPDPRPAAEIPCRDEALGTLACSK